MKTTLLLFVSLLLLNSSIANNTKKEVKNNSALEGTISIFTSPDLYNLTTKWAYEYCNIDPSVQIKVIPIEGSSIDKVLGRGKTLGFISSKYISKLNNNSIWKIVVGRDIIVPIINAKNPFLDALYQQGVSSKALAQIFENTEGQKWATLLKKGQNTPIHYYLINDESINLRVANFLNIKQATIDGIQLDNEKNMISSIQKDPLAIGFCKMTDILNPSNKSIVENIKLLPIDKNGNGEIDYFEDIYANLNNVSRAAWIGKYPQALTYKLYSIFPTKPTNKIEVAFLKWILTDGQQFLNPAGYSDLVFNERQSAIEKLYKADINTVTSDNKYAFSRKPLITIAAFSIIALIVMVLLEFGAIQFLEYKKAAGQIATSISPLIFNRDSVTIPAGLFYDKSHTWAFMEKNGKVSIGIDDFLQHITGPITRIKMKDIGDKIKKGQRVLSIMQNGKQLNIYAPISGTIKAQNEALNSDSSILNESPYFDGWVYSIEPLNWYREIQFLITEKKYKDWIQSEFSRLKDFFSVTLKPNTTKYAYSVLQDGGELRDGVLADLGPEVWEDFQTNFIDTSKEIINDSLFYIQ